MMVEFYGLSEYVYVVREETCTFSTANGLNCVVVRVPSRL